MPAHEYFATCSISLKKLLAAKIYFYSVPDAVACKLILHRRRTRCKKITTNVRRRLNFFL